MHAEINRKLNNELLAVAVTALLAGVVFYWTCRPAGSAQFLSLLPPFPSEQNSELLARWLGWLPTFFHVFGFALLTYLALGRRHALFACVLWGLINAFFEIGQALPAGTTRLLPDFLNLHTYFNRGVFDPLDLVACAMGAWAAWAMIRTGESHEN